MNSRNGRGRGAIWMASASTLILGSVLGGGVAWACGGFFCQQVPIDQAAEQIIFRQDGDIVTAVVLIQYVGEAEDFSWVVPVSGVPEFSVGSARLFTQLELATRPQFNLAVEGSECPQDFFFGGGNAPTSVADGADADEAGDDGVTVLDQSVVGPFDVSVVMSEDPEAMATWLDENDYDLSERGAELIEPYVNEGKNFVAVRLRQDQGVGDIQPLIMRCQTGRPVIPIRLTAVAAMEDMGVLVWFLGSSRAVPVNYLAVEVNYTRLNWYFGSTNAYASYQGLVTAAMDEAGGQGFATDYAGTDVEGIVSQLPSPEELRAELVRLAGLETSDFYGQLSFNGLFDPAKVSEILRRQLPLPEGEDEFIYSVPELLEMVFDEMTLATAKGQILGDLLDAELIPLEDTLAVFDGIPYLTRLYTTLSPAEMTLDPEFVFNPDVEDQSMERNATLTLDCVNDQSQWELMLGPGTGRDGEVVIRGFGDPPIFGFGSVPTIDQAAVASTAIIRESGAPELMDVNDFELATVGEPAAPVLFNLGEICGAGVAWIGWLGVVGLVATNAVRRRPSCRAASE